jgi:DNA-binding CsgD family transcriptional regulator
LVCVEGEPGIGKTSLIQTFLERVAPPVVLWASGDADEAGLPFGTLAQLFGRATSRSAQARPVDLDVGADPVVLGRHLLNRLGEAQGRDVVVLVVEDLHWVDHPSAVAIRFALRRLSGDRVIVILSTRPGIGTGNDDGWRRVVDDRGIRLRLGGLSASELAELVQASQGVSNPAAAARLRIHTGGNPFYARCVLEELDAAELAGTGPLRVPRSLASMFVTRLAQCGPEATALVAAAAVLGERCSLVQAITLAEIARPAPALGLAAEAGLVSEREGPGWRELAFTHPLVRAAVYEDLSPARRVELHAKAARILGGSAAVMHRVAATLGPDDELATELSDEAEAQAAEGSFGLAARRFWQAAKLAADPASRDERMLWAFACWLQGGELQEIAARREHLDGLPASFLRDLVAGSVAVFEAQPAQARLALRRADQWIADPSNGAEAAQELTALLIATALYDFEWQEALRLVSTVRGTPGSTLLYTSAIALGMAGRGQEARELLDTELRAPPGGPSRDPLVVTAGAEVQMWMDDPEGSRRLVETALAGAVERTTTSDFDHHCVRAEACYRLGALSEALAVAELALSLFSAIGRVGGRGIDALSVATWAASARGDWEMAEELVEQVEQLCGPETARYFQVRAASARWALAAEREDLDAMLRAAQTVDILTGVPEPGLLPFGPVLAEALLRTGDLDAAKSNLERYEAVAAAAGRTSALVAAARVRGLLLAETGDPTSGVECFEHTAAMADGLPLPLVSASFWLAYGDVLAQCGRRSDALAQFHRARETFDGVGAQPALERASRRLRALGQRLPRRSSDRRLTATESVVARLVASGLTNREVADQIVISPKGVEYHLGNVYAKLGVHSRTRLAAALEPLGDPPATKY